MADGSRHRRWLSGLVTKRTPNGGDVHTGTDSRDPLVAYYRDLRRIADNDARTKRSLAP
jgi:hypothetical protein